MSKTLFTVSDIHSFYTPLKEALDAAGFDQNNENHWLIVCGDAFDRGGESEEVLHFLMSLDRKILIRGNHETLLEECCLREEVFPHDISNGTERTVLDLGGADEGNSFAKCCRITWNKTAAYRALLQNYFETENYIFVHSWIPPAIRIDRDRTYDENWRKASNYWWKKAMWVNPFDMYFLDLNKTGKTIVFGHWHCSAGHKMLGRCKDEFNNAIWYPCYAEGIIGIDRCTAYTGEVNVLVLEDDFLDE